MADRDPLHQARIAEAAEILLEAQKKISRRLSDREMADELGYSLKTFQRAVKDDPGAITCAVLLPREGKPPLRRWRAWELELRWSGVVLPTSQRETQRKKGSGE